MKKISAGRLGRPDDVVIEIPDYAWARPFDVRDAGAQRRDMSVESAQRSGGLVDDALTDALEAAGFEIAGDALAHLAPEGAFRSAPGEAGAVKVMTGPGENALLLVESEGGVFGWMRPQADDASGERRGTPGSVIFEFPLAEQTGTRGGLRSWLSEALLRPIRVRVLKFAARLTIEAAAARIESGNPAGLVAVDGKTPSLWKANVGVPQISAPTDRPARVLLLAHGTFSSTAGSFGHLALNTDGEAFLDAALSTYDAVLGFDHKTLTEDVETNAEALADALSGLPQGAIVDAIAFSRGGLLLRILVEEIFPLRRPDVRFRKAVFVGCANAGTHLAEPDNWDALVNLYTNVVMAGARVVTGFSGAVALGALIYVAMKTLGEFAQALAQEAVAERLLPGLASMRPGGATARRLLALDGPLSNPPDYYVVQSNFTPRFEPSKGLTRELAQLLLDRVTNDLWRGAPNDLVVDTDSMSNFGARGKLFWKGRELDFGDTEAVYHTIYFASPRLCRYLCETLDLPMTDDAATHSEASMDFSRLEEASASLESMSRWTPIIKEYGSLLPITPSEQAGAYGDGRRSAPERVIFAGRDEGPFSPDPEEPSFSCNVMASMPEAPRLGRSVDLDVTLSHEDIEAPAGAVYAAKKLSVAPGRKIRIQVVARSNCVIVGEDEEGISPPAPGEPQNLTFRLRGTAAGPAEVWVNAYQGPLRLARLVLQPRFSAAGTITAFASAQSGAPDLPLLDLNIFEDRLADGGWRLRFLASCEELGVHNDYQTDDNAFNRSDKIDYVKALYKRLENWAADDQADYKALSLSARNVGSVLFRGLFPEALRRLLWDNRERIGSIQVFSREPSIPWEIAYMTAPDGDSAQRGGAFLAEMGLTRWIANVPLPPVRLRLRQGKALYCAPDYLDRNYRLAHVEQEVSMLKTLLDAKPVEGRLGPILKTLAQEDDVDFDLLHFACHGAGDPEQVWNSGLILAGFIRNNRVVREELSVDDVSAGAALDKDDVRRIIFLNACQSGVGGYALSGAGGLAQAFVQKGAGLFVGTLWSIGDQPAVPFCEAFYKGLKVGRTVMESIRAARQAAKGARNDFTWLAYTVYGHPYARVSMEDVPAA
ncbi:CHAT domain-containing protein [Methylocella sp.]|uniref:DUF7379 domain-containing protein n=1 Tax=Methylocella sp. TaxID=1978226 RepID=UPI003784B898